MAEMAAESGQAHGTLGIPYSNPPRWPPLLGLDYVHSEGARSHPIGRMKVKEKFGKNR